MMRGALERRLAAANRRIRDDMPSQFNARSISVSLRFHADAADYAPRAFRLQAGDFG